MPVSCLHADKQKDTAFVCANSIAIIIIKIICIILCRLSIQTVHCHNHHICLLPLTDLIQSCFQFFLFQFTEKIRTVYQPWELPRFRYDIFLCCCRKPDHQHTHKTYKQSTEKQDSSVRSCSVHIPHSSYNIHNRDKILNAATLIPTVSPTNQRT